MNLVNLRPLSETLRVRHLLCLRKQLLWEHENTKPSPCLAAFVGHFEWESEPPVTVEGRIGYFGSSASPIAFHLEAAGLHPSLLGRRARVMEASRADFERAARSAIVSPRDPSPESFVSSGLPPEGQEGQDARYNFLCPHCGWGSRFRTTASLSLYLGARISL